MFKYWFLLIGIGISTAVLAQTPSDLNTGDLLFINLDCGPMCDAINEVTYGYQDLKFNHVGMVVKTGDEIRVIEALSPAVREVPLRDFLNYTREQVYVGRLKLPYESLIPDAIAFAQEQLGTPYDDGFIYDNGKYYCSELIYDAFLAALGKPLFELYPMTYKPAGSADFFPIWVAYFKQLGQVIPEGLPGCNPAGLSTSQQLSVFKLAL